MLFMCYFYRYFHGRTLDELYTQAPATRFVKFWKFPSTLSWYSSLSTQIPHKQNEMWNKLIGDFFQSQMTKIDKYFIGSYIYLHKPSTMNKMWHKVNFLSEF